MDIKYVGSGEAAKALVFYITDYITKSTLPAHVGLAAVEYAIKRNEEKFKRREDFPTEAEVDKSLFTKTVMAIMAKQELSHQQVMSYLVGGGDHYTSHTFRVLQWGHFDWLVSKWEKSVPIVSMEDLDDFEGEDDEREAAGDMHSEPEVVLILDGSNVVNISNEIADYCLRSVDEEFNRLSLWEFAEWTTKLTQKSEDLRLENSPENSADSTVKSRRKAGKRALPRGKFVSAQHSQFDTHLLQLRSIPQVPVLLGPTLPRPDRSQAEYERWCRAMLVIFSPWREPSDLKHPDETWKDAFS
jgi:hypothetical protein